MATDGLAVAVGLAVLMFALAVLLLSLTACTPATPTRPVPSTFGPCTHGTVKLIKGVWKCER